MLQQLLTFRLRTASSVALLGVGSELRGDDAVGMRVAEILEQRDAHPRLKIHLGSTAPENATGPIRKQNPTHLVIVDAVALGASPGEVAILERSDIAGTTFCTHTLPLSVVLDFIGYDNPTLDIFVIAIQAEHLLFGEALSERVEHAAQAIAHALYESLPNAERSA
ncbi:MAG: hydrogenase 3 maturation endopeptidase HyCI [Polyangiaceae bacterium]